MKLDYRPEARFSQLPSAPGSLTEFNRVLNKKYTIKHNGGYGDRYMFRVEDADGNTVDQGDNWNALAARWMGK